MQHKIVRISAFRVLAPRTLWLKFDDGLERTIDFSPVLAGELYKPLNDPDYFAQVRLDPEVQTVVWPNGADFDPETLHDWPSVESAWTERAKHWSQGWVGDVATEGHQGGLRSAG
jgi:hypothetical protein